MVLMLIKENLIREDDNKNYESALTFDTKSSDFIGYPIQLGCGTLVVLLRCSLVPEILNRGSPDVFLHK
jgi:hypothetical protein